VRCADLHGRPINWAMNAHTKTAEPKLNRQGLWQQEINLTFRLPLQLREDFGAAAIRAGVPSSALVRKIVMDWLTREGSR
jgi:hypothetical protein